MEPIKGSQYVPLGWSEYNDFTIVWEGKDEQNYLVEMVLKTLWKQLCIVMIFYTVFLSIVNHFLSSGIGASKSPFIGRLVGLSVGLSHFLNISGSNYPMKLKFSGNEYLYIQRWSEKKMKLRVVFTTKFVFKVTILTIFMVKFRGEDDI